MDKRWYVLTVVSGQEKKAAQAIMAEVESQGVADIEEVVVPAEEITEVKRGKQVSTERKFFPGYIMIKMIMSDKGWHLIKGVSKISGFLGSQGRPQPISNVEAERIFKQIEDGVSADNSIIIYDAGEKVNIIDGPFDSFVGTVEDVDNEKGRLKVSVMIFGRSTPVELEFSQVKKLEE